MFKQLVGSFLVNDLSGAAIRWAFGNQIRNIRWSGYRFELPEGNKVHGYTAAQIYWGFYESAEVRFVEKYLGNHMPRDVIELGSSLGIVSSHVVSKVNSPNRVVCVEANPMLVPTLEANIEKNNRNKIQVNVLNNAYSYDSQCLEFCITNNHLTSAKGRPSDSSQTIEGKSLIRIIDEFELNEFVLVSDIEGAEVEFLLMESEALKRCTAMILEIHDTQFQGSAYSRTEICKLITSRNGFEIVDAYGPIVYCRR